MSLELMKTREMPSASMFTITTMGASDPIKCNEFDISSRDVVENLVMEIKENLRLSATNTLKAVPCSHVSRKSSRASPYKIPGRFSCGTSSCNSECFETINRPRQEIIEDPYELLQQLLKNGNLVNEAVRRVQLGLTTKQKCYYDSDEESSRSPVLHLYQDN